MDTIRLRTAKSILGAVLAILMAVLLTLLNCITYADDPVNERVITAIISCSAGIATLVSIMFLLAVSNSVSAISYGSRPTRTEKAEKQDWTWRFLPPSETEKP